MSTRIDDNIEPDGAGRSGAGVGDVRISPYPGLRPYGRDDAAFFFGREAQTEELGQYLEDHRWVAVVGPSGCGKSSLVRAGLLPELNEGLVGGVDGPWRIVEMRPGGRPLMALAEQLVDDGIWESSPEPSKEITSQNHTEQGDSAQEAEEIAGKLQRDVNAVYAELLRGPRSLLKLLGNVGDKQTPCLWLIDQFEELFRALRAVTPGRERNVDEIEAFVSLLLETIAAANEKREPPIYVILTMRSDFIDECDRFARLPEVLNDGLFLTPRMTWDQRETAIIGPATEMGGEVERGLVSRLLNDMGDQPDQLPLMQHALMRVWIDARERNTGDEPIRLTVADYERLGGWDKMLSRHADKALEELTEEQRQLAESMFRRITERSSGQRDLRNPTSLREVAQVAGSTEAEIRRVVEVFRDPTRCFMTPGAGERLDSERLLDISHEALIRQWETLEAWAANEAEAAATYRRLLQDAKIWKSKGGELWAGVNLQDAIRFRQAQPAPARWAERYGGEFSLCDEFLNESEIREQEREEEERENERVRLEVEKQRAIQQEQQRRLEAESKRAEEAERRREAEAQRAAEAEQRRQVAQSAKVWFRSLASIALIFAIAAIVSAIVAIYRGKHARRETALNTYQVGRYYGQAGLLSQAVVSLIKSAKVADDVGWDYDLQLRDSALRLAAGWARTTPREIYLEGTGNISSVAVSPNGDMFAAIDSQNGDVCVWEIDSGKRRVFRANADPLALASITFNRDGSRLLYVSNKASARIWELLNQDDTNETLQKGVAVFANDGSVNTRPFSTEVTAMALNQDGTTIAWGTGGGETWVWDNAGEPKRLAPKADDDSAITFLAISSDGTHVVSGDYYGDARLWKDGQPVTELTAIQSAVAISPDNKNLLVGKLDGTAELWDLTEFNGQDSPKPRQLSDQNGQPVSELSSVAFSPDGKTCVIGIRTNASAILVDTKTGNACSPPMHHGDSLGSATFLHDMHVLTTGDYKTAGSTARVWAAHEQLPDAQLETETIAYSWALGYDSAKKQLVVFDYDIAKLYDCDPNATQSKLEPIDSMSLEPVSIGSLSPNGSFVVAADLVLIEPDNTEEPKSENVFIRITNIQSGKSIRHQHFLHNESVEIKSVAVSSDGKRVAIGFSDGLIKLIPPPKENAQISHPLAVTALNFAADGTTIVSGSDDGTVKQWDFASGKLLRTFEHGSEITAVATAANGQLVAAASGNEAWLWDTFKQAKIGEPYIHPDDITAITFNPDSSTFYTTTGFGGVNTWPVPQPIALKDVDRWIEKLMSKAQWATTLASLDSAAEYFSGVFPED